MAGHRLAGLDRRLTMIGCGKMAGAMLDRWLACGLDPVRTEVVRPSGTPVADGVRVARDCNALTHRPADLLMLGIKPQQLSALGDDLRSLVDPDTVLLSILAGVTVAELRAMTGARRIVRLMPNMPVRIGRGVVLRAGVEDADVDRLIATLGTVRHLPDETHFDLYTALTGSGPAFIYAFIDAMATAARRLGMPGDDAVILSRAMVDGAVADAATTDAAPSALIAAVASKGGMTQQGLDILAQDDALATLLTNMLRATRDRGAALADAARRMPDNAPA